MTKSKSGFTLLETMIVVAIFGIIVVVIVTFFSKSTPYYRQTQARQQLMVSSREVMDTVIDRLRNGRARTIGFSTPGTSTSVVPYSRVDFELQTMLPSGATAYAIYLDNTSNTLYTQEFTISPPAATAGAQPPRVLATGVTGINFTSNSQDPGIVGVTLTMSVPWDPSGDPTHVASLLLPTQTVHMVESP